MEEYDDKESINLAEALQRKAEQECLKKGLSRTEISKTGIKKYNEVRRHHAIEFMERLNQKLDSLSNQSIANLLKALITLGLPIEDDEELDFWINLLARESFNRLATYFDNKKTKKHKEYTSDDIKSFMDIITSFQKISEQKTTNVQKKEKRKNFFNKIHKILKKDLITKQNSVYSKNSQKRQRHNEQPLDILKNKMISEGIEIGSSYWNKVIADFDSSLDKAEFAKNWTIDNNIKTELDKDKIQELRGVEFNKRQNKQQKEQEKAQKEQNKNAAAQEFSNKKNQKRAEKTVEKLNRPIKQDEMARLKMVIKSGKEF